MTLKETLMDEMKNAMKEKDEMKKNTVTMVRAAIKQYEVDNRVELDDNGVIDIIAKEVKKRKDALPEYEKSGRTDLIDGLNLEINYLMKYLPEQLSADELKKIVTDTIAETGATSMKDMGKVMAAVTAKTKGRADGKTISSLVKEMLG
ncbi:MAG: GatB/YqeY domain-containing protein [Clostridia bacterium]|nr:GatB/YqeY domain-containing protein [Clostridia bacterium]